MGRKSQGEPQFTKATYPAPKKRAETMAPSPARRRAAEEDAARDAARSRDALKRFAANPVGFVRPDLKPEIQAAKPIRRLPVSRG